MKIQYAYSKDEDKLITRVAQDLADGKIVGWFQGRSEFGPRALGNRSILVDPGLPNAKDYMNKKVKHREHWRPYAPVTLENQELNGCFDIFRPSPYMLFSSLVIADNLPGITHEDGTARIQTVTMEQNKRMYMLLVAFNNIKMGYPVLLNTSFNMAGEPIVETPQDAIKTFQETEIDILVMEDVYIRKVKE